MQRALAGAALAFIPRGRISFERPQGKTGHGPIGSVLIARGPDNAAALRRIGLAGIFFKPSIRTHPAAT